MVIHLLFHAAGLRSNILNFLKANSYAVVITDNKLKSTRLARKCCTE